MKRRDFSKWKSLPGGFDEFHLLEHEFLSDNQYGIPNLLPQYRLRIPENIRLKGYRQQRPDRIDISKDICHFFLFDEKFITTFSRPRAALGHVRKYYAALEPNFSLYSDWPLAVQIYNTFRTRWVGRFWQEHGVKVIPTVNWSTPASYSFCFLGIPRNQIVAIKVPDIRKPATRFLFIQGFEQMRQILKPKLVIVQGNILKLIDTDVPLCQFPVYDRFKDKEEIEVLALEDNSLQVD